jgi:RNA-binding protein NOB1
MEIVPQSPGPKSSEEPSATVTVEDITDQLESTSLGDLNETGDHEGDTALLSENDPDHDVEGGTQWAEGDIEHRPLDLSDVGSTAVTDDKPTNTPTQGPSCTPIYDDPSDEDDGEGEWITPSNVAIHKSRALDLLPDDGLKGKKVVPITSGCMTADFAMQNVLLQMGLNLVGLEGNRIEKIKTWVLRCHACFKYGLSSFPSTSLSYFISEYAKIIRRSFVPLVVIPLYSERL